MCGTVAPTGTRTPAKAHVPHPPDLRPTARGHRAMVEEAGAGAEAGKAEQPARAHRLREGPLGRLALARQPPPTRRKG